MNAKHYSMVDAGDNVVGCVTTANRQELNILRQGMERVMGTLEESERTFCPFCSGEDAE